MQETSVPPKLYGGSLLSGNVDGATLRNVFRRLQGCGFQICGFRKYGKAVHNSIYRVDTDRMPLIIKCYRADSLSGNTESRVMTEAYVLKKAPGVPELVVMNLDPPWVARELISGIPFRKMIVDPSQRANAVRLLGTWLSKFHFAFGPATVSVDQGEGSRHNIVLNHLKWLGKRWIDEVRAQRLASRLRVRPHTEVAARLMGDTDISNFLCVRSGRNLIGLDFEHSHYGDVAKDLACAAASSAVWTDVDPPDSLLAPLEDSYRSLTRCKGSLATDFYLLYFVIWMSYLHPARRKRCCGILASLDAPERDPV